MAGDWIKVEKITPDKPEIEAMAARLDIDPDAVFGKCFRLWRWFDDHTTNGNASCVTKALLDRRAGVNGFAEAMESVGWLQFTNDGVVLPRFDRHNGETSKQRALTAKRASKNRAKSNANSNATVTHGALPREEKRREELIGLASANPLSAAEPLDSGGEGPRLFLDEVQSDDSEAIKRAASELVKAWNTTAGVRRFESWNDSRRTAFRARIKARLQTIDGRRPWIDVALESLKKFPLKCFTNRDDGYLPDLDWFLRPRTVTKIIEGTYDFTPSGPKVRPQRKGFA